MRCNTLAELEALLADIPSHGGLPPTLPPFPRARRRVERHAEPCALCQGECVVYANPSGINGAFVPEDCQRCGGTGRAHR